MQILHTAFQPFKAVDYCFRELRCSVTRHNFDVSKLSQPRSNFDLSRV